MCHEPTVELPLFTVRNKVNNGRSATEVGEVAFLEFEILPLLSEQRCDGFFQVDEILVEAP